MEIGLKSFIVANTSPELCDLLEDIDTLVAKFGIEDHDEHILELVLTQQTRAAGETIDVITKMYSEMLFSFFDQHGITLADEITLHTQYKLALGIYYLQDYSDKETVKNIVETAISTEEAFAEIFTLVTDEVAENILVYVEFVQPDFLTALINTLPDNEVIYNETQLSEHTRLKMLSSLADFKLFAADVDGLIPKAIESGMTVGYTFDIYASLIQHNLQILKPKQVAYDLFLASMISIDHHGNVIMNVRDYVSKNFMEPDFVTSVLIEASDLAVRYEKYILAKGNKNG
jgi:hypothetical protein